MKAEAVSFTDHSTTSEQLALLLKQPSHQSSVRSKLTVSSYDALQRVFANSTSALLLYRMPDANRPRSTDVVWRSCAKTDAEAAVTCNAVFRHKTSIVFGYTIDISNNTRAYNSPWE